MSRPIETDRPWELIEDHIHYDLRLDQYNLRDRVVEAVAAIRKQVGTGHIEAIPHKWELDQNFSSIAIRGEGSDEPVNQVFALDPVRRIEYRLVAVPADRPE